MGGGGLDVLQTSDDGVVQALTIVRPHHPTSERKGRERADLGNLLIKPILRR